MEKWTALSALEEDLKTLRTGRASASILEGIMASADGNGDADPAGRHNQHADAATIQIQPWDAGLVKSVEKAILEANLGMTPSNDGKIIRLRVPQLTQETRKEIVKKAHDLAEHARVAVRNVRRHLNDEIKKMEKDHKLTEDESKRD